VIFSLNIIKTSKSSRNEAQKKEEREKLLKKGNKKGRKRKAPIFK
jgi:hypothetical protein